MNWGEFKKEVEEAGVTDDCELMRIDYSGFAKMDVRLYDGCAECPECPKTFHIS